MMAMRTRYSYCQMRQTKTTALTLNNACLSNVKHKMTGNYDIITHNNIDAEVTRFTCTCRCSNYDHCLWTTHTHTQLNAMSCDFQQRHFYVRAPLFLPSSIPPPPPPAFCCLAHSLLALFAASRSPSPLIFLYTFH